MMHSQVDRLSRRMTRAFVALGACALTACATTDKPAPTTSPTEGQAGQPAEAQPVEAQPAAASTTTATASPGVQAGVGPEAIATLTGAPGSSVKGVVEFYSLPGDRVRVVANITGLTPGQHGFHLHEKGDCSAPDFTSAGSHWNPGGHPHAGPAAAMRHAGDLGNLEANASGEAKVSIEVDGISVTGPADGQRSAVGKAVIVHEKADDFTTQPTGNAGGRIACGVVHGR